MQKNIRSYSGRDPYDSDLITLIFAKGKQDADRKRYVYTEEQLIDHYRQYQSRWRFNPRPPKIEGTQTRLSSAMHAAAARGLSKLFRLLVNSRGNKHFWSRDALRDAIEIADRFGHDGIADFIDEKLSKKEYAEAAAQAKAAPQIIGHESDLTKYVMKRMLNSLRDALRDEDKEFTRDEVRSAYEQAKVIGWDDGMLELAKYADVDKLDDGGDVSKGDKPVENDDAIDTDIAHATGAANAFVADVEKFASDASKFIAVAPGVDTRAWRTHYDIVLTAAVEAAEAIEQDIEDESQSPQRVKRLIRSLKQLFKVIDNTSKRIVTILNARVDAAQDVIKARDAKMKQFKRTLLTASKDTIPTIKADIAKLRRDSEQEEQLMDDIESWVEDISEMHTIVMASLDRETRKFIN